MFKQKMNALKEKCKELPLLHKIGIGGATIGGGYIGSSIGIAALGTAVAGTAPIAIICGLGAGAGALAYSHIKKLETKLEEHRKKSDEDNVIK